MVCESYENCSDEEYVVLRAKNTLKTDPIAAKAWMITAKSLYPNNFNVNFEAYKMEKEARNVEETANCFSYLLENFQEEKFWKEVETVIAALRSESDANDTENQFLCDMFKHISSDVQHKLLLLTADRCEDAIEHCKLLLLLLQRFPMTISSHGPRLVETLLSAEKHSHANNQPVNIYRKLLITDLLPLLACENVSFELSSKLLFKLIHKGTEYYLHYIFNPTEFKETETKIDKPWEKLFSLLELIGKHLNWESYLISFGNNWTKESYWQKIMTFCQNHKVPTVEDSANNKQLLYCLVIFFLYCLDEYKSSLTPDASPGQVQTSFILVEAFTDNSLSTNTSLEPKSKRRRTESESSTPSITVDKPENKNIVNNFVMASNCWDLLHSSDVLTREFIKLHNHLKLDQIVEEFLTDYYLYKKCYDEALKSLKPEVNVARSVRLANLYYLKKNFTGCFENIILAVKALNSNNPGCLSSQLIIGGNHRHLHYLPLTLNAILQFCVKLLIRCIKENTQNSPIYSDLVVGNLLVLIQLDWPIESDFLPFLVNQIQQKGSFSYMLFQNYIINVDILEEFSFLWSERGGNINLEILPHLGQRRIGTRGADKGVKEEIKSAIKRQITKSNERLDQLLIKFITQERGHIQQSLM